MNFGKKLKELRNAYELTQGQLAQKLDTSKSNISKYESNTIEPNLKTLILISQYFNVSIDYLLGNSIPKTPLSTKTSWNTVLNSYPDAIRVTPEINDLIDYYNELSLKDKRWIMGQMIDLIKKAENNDTHTVQRIAE